MEAVAGQPAVIKRPGLKNLGLTFSGKGLGSFCSNSLYAVNYSSPNTITTSALAPASGHVASSNLTFVTVSGNYAYAVQQATGNLYVIDISNATAPVVVGSIFVGNSPRQPAYYNGLVYVPCYNTALMQVYDVTTPTAPTNVGSVSLLYGTGASVAAGYILGYGDGGIVYIFTPGSTPVYTGVSINVTSPVGSAVYDPIGKYLYITNSIGGSIYSYNFINPLAPTLAYSRATGLNILCLTINSADGHLYGVSSAATGNHFYVTTIPDLTVKYDAVSPVGASFTSITNIGNIAYFTGSTVSDVLYKADVSDPAAPVFSTVSSTAVGTPAFVFSDGIKAVEVGSSGIYSFDNTNQVLSVSATTTVAGDSSTYQWSVPTGASTLLVLKNNTAMSTLNTTTGVVTQVTDPNYPAITVPGLVQLDGTFYVAKSTGEIYGSAINDPTTWSALNYITAEIEPDSIVAIDKVLNYLVAFGAWTTEFFYDAGNATGSPLSSVPNAFFTIGCASGASVVRTENMVVWMSQTLQRGRQIMVLNGFQPELISNPQVDRILNADDLANVYAFAIRTNGGNFYVLTLKTSGKTLVYNFTTKEWHFWSSMLPQTAKSVTSITSANGVATVTQTAHGYADGDVVVIAGATPTAYNGSKNITYIDANTYSYPIAVGTATPATGTITAYGFTEQYFRGIGYTACLGGDLIQDELTGVVYKMDPTLYDDDGNYINMFVRTVRIDGGNAKRKFNSKAEVIGDKVDATALVRYTDDDYRTFSTYRRADLTAKRSMLTRLGHTRRRAYDIRITDAQPIRLGAIEVDMEQGTS